MNKSYRDLNAQLNIWGDNGELQLDKDKEAAHAFFIEEVNPNTVFFHDLEEKVKYMVDNGHWKQECFDKYDFTDVKELFKYAYGFKFRFPTFMGAYKFYHQYALKTPDGSRWLERYEDRVVMNALEFASNLDHAYRVVESIITGVFQPATPTFLNAGRANAGQPVSCFLLRIEDSMVNIGRAVHESLQLSKNGGGVALLLTNLREEGAPIKGFENQASGVIPVMKLLEDSFSYANQLGQRQGAGAVYLHAHHPDIMKFLDTKRENADEKIRIKTLSLGIVVPDITFELARNNEDMYLFSPYDVERVFGKPFSEVEVTKHYHEMVEDPRIRKTKIKARKFFQTVAEIQFESGYPYYMFEDNANKWNPIPNYGRINMSNLCVTGDTRIWTERGLLTAEEAFVRRAPLKVAVDKRIHDDLWHESSAMHKTAEQADVYEVELANGQRVKATQWHKFYVERDGKVHKLPLKDLDMDDKCLIMSNEVESGVLSSAQDMAYISGCAVSSGTWGAKESFRITVPEKREYLLNRIANAGNAAIELGLQLRVAEHDFIRQYNITFSPNNRGVNFRCNSVILGRVLDGYAGLNKDTADRIPDFIWRSDIHTRKAFLAGLFALNGGLYTHNNGQSRLTYSSPHRRLLEEVQQLFLTLGIPSSVYTSPKLGRTTLTIMHPDMILKAQDFLRLGYERIEKWESNARKDSPLEPAFTSRIASITYVGKEDVYDVTVDGTHAVTFNGFVTGNCNEIMQPNSPAVLDAAGAVVEAGKDISCNLGSLNVAKMMKLSRPGKVMAIHTAVMFLTNVSLGSELGMAPSIENGNRLTRAIGLGQMNLHGYLIEQGIQYDSDEARAFFAQYMASISVWSEMASRSLSDLYGAFEGYEHSKWASGEYGLQKWQAYKDMPKADHPELMSELEVEQYWTRKHFDPMANAHLQAIPPTGSISYINHATSSIHPVTSVIETRKEGITGRTYYPAYGLTADNAGDIVTAYDTDQAAVIAMYACAAPFVDQGISATLFFKDTATTRDLNKMQILAWKKGLKGLYYVRLLQKALTGTEVAECVSCQL